MTEVTIMVTEEVADALMQLVRKGHLKSVRGRKGRARYTAFCLAGYSRPIRGDRWIRIGEASDVTVGWARIPERYSYGG
jgi:hypothetical protein